jgi:nonsense-mediated mRNA decay protein 3
MQSVLCHACKLDGAFSKWLPCFTSHRLRSYSLCCICGIGMDPNPANKCVNCLRTEVDITDGIPKTVLLHQCRGCFRYLRPGWVSAELESRELLAVCLKRITGLSRIKLVDAGFIWTEPHSRRLKVKLTIQKEVLNGVKLQQVFAVDFTLQNQQCDACQRSYTAHTWRASVQVRNLLFSIISGIICQYHLHG